MLGEVIMTFYTKSARESFTHYLAGHNFSHSREKIVHECDVSVGDHKSFTDTETRNNFCR